jgi:hypothetical protein
MEETPLESIPSFSAPAKRKINKRFTYILLVGLLILFIFFAFKLFGDNSQTVNQKPAISPIEIPTDTPVPFPTDTPRPDVTATPTPKPTVNPVDSQTGLDRSKLSVTVENGSGTVGAASKASDVLKNLGYDVVSSGNADNFNYSNASIQVKSTSSNYLTLLENDLGTNYTIGSTSADLDDGFSSDALVIIGQ